MFKSLNPWAEGVLPSWGVVFLRGAPILIAHLACLGVFFVETTVYDWMLLLMMGYVRGLGITIAYHRYFSHRSFKTGRLTQFLLAAWGCTLLQMGPLWWAAHHRRHHLHSDGEGDLHSPRKGFLWAHGLWAFRPGITDPNWGTIRDFTRYPELRVLEKFCHVPALLLAATFFLIGGWGTLLVGFCMSTVLVYFFTNSVNSIGHLFGRRNFDTRDDSRNNIILGFLALGDGWHNNHHRYPRSACHGFYWWETDASYRVICLMKWLGLVWDVRVVPDCVRYPDRNRGQTTTSPSPDPVSEAECVGAGQPGEPG
jgi:stearoyl-CoA desaturase (Delta-9 desaturase)